MKIYLGLNGEKIEPTIRSQFAGVGLIRGEYLCRGVGAYVTMEKAQEAIRIYTAEIAALFAPDPVWYRFVDMESSELNHLQGVDHLIKEKTTMLGLRGARRALKFPGAFAAEVDAVTCTAKGASNLHVLLPYIHDVREFVALRDVIVSRGFPNEVGMMAEIPSMILTLDEAFSAGVSTVLIGVNDLTSLTLGAHRQSGLYSPTHPAVLRLVEVALERAAAANVSAMVGGDITPGLIAALPGLGCVNIVLHYSFLGKLFPGKFSNLSHTMDIEGLLEEIRLKVDGLPHSEGTS